MEKMERGISPLVAAVLLIAVTMTIAGVLAYWASGFVRSQTIMFENQTVTSECNFGNFQSSCSYDSNASKMNLLLDNVGSIDLKNLIVFVIYPNTTVSNFTINETLTSRSVIGASLAGVSSGFSKVTIKTHCSNVFIDSACPK